MKLNNKAIKYMLLSCAACIALPALAPAKELAPRIKPVQQEIAEATAQATAAIKRCDSKSYEDAIEWLDDIAFDSSRDRAESIEDTIDMLDGQWNATFPCGMAPRDNEYAWDMSTSFGSYKLHDGPVYLGKENGGFINTLSLVRPDRTDNVFRLATGFRMSLLNVLYNMPNNTRNSPRKNLALWDIDFGMSHTHSSLDDNFGSITTGGDTLLLPGVGSGSNGAEFSLPFAGGLNTVRDAMFRSDYTSNRVSLGFGKTIQRNQVKLRPYGGFEYGSFNSNQRFGGSIPGYARDFNYDTHIDQDSYSPFIGIEAGFKPSFLKGSKVPVEFYGGVKYKLSYNDTSARDTLSFTGFSPQTINVNDNKFTHGGSITAGVRFQLSQEASLGVGYTYEVEGNTPSVTRDGAGPSRVDYGVSAAHLAALDVRIKWGR